MNVINFNTLKDKVFRCSCAYNGLAPKNNSERANRLGPNGLIMADRRRTIALSKANPSACFFLFLFFWEGKKERKRNE